MKTQKSKFSNSDIGSHHWAATLLSFIMRVGEYMREHPEPSFKDSLNYPDWGDGIKERANEINEYLHAIPEVEFIDEIKTLKEKEIRGDRLISKLYHEKTVLESELVKANKKTEYKCDGNCNGDPRECAQYGCKKPEVDQPEESKESQEEEPIESIVKRWRKELNEPPEYEDDLWSEVGNVLSRDFIPNDPFSLHKVIDNSLKGKFTITRK